MEAFSDDGKTTGYAVNGVDYSGTLSGGTPSGKRDIVSGFGNAKYDTHRLAHRFGASVTTGITPRDRRWSMAGRYVASSVTLSFLPCLAPSYPRRLFRPAFALGEVQLENIPILGPEYTPRYNADVDKSGGALLPSVTIAVKPFEWLQPFVKYSKITPPTIMESFLNGGTTDKASMNMRQIRLSGPNEAKPTRWAQT